MVTAGTLDEMGSTSDRAWSLRPVAS
jgi:hypothetical protein